MRIHVTAATLVLLASLFFRVSRVEFLAVLLTISFVIGTELVNTAVEATIDVATDGFDLWARSQKTSRQARCW